MVNRIAASIGRKFIKGIGAKEIIMKDNILVTAKIPRLFLTFVLSSVISMVLVGIQGMVDGIFLGNYESSNAMASVNIASPYMQLILGCCFVLCTGTLSYLGRTLGEKDIGEL